MSAFLTAAVAKVTSGRTPAPRVYTFGAVPVSPVYPYSVVGASLADAGNYTLDAAHGTRNVRVTVQSFGKTSAAALAYDAAADANLLDQRLAVAGFECGPIRLQVTSPLLRDPDDEGVIGITSAYIFTTTKEQP